MKQAIKKQTRAQLASGSGVTLAVDTEYQGAETLTIQFAMRDGDCVRVQLYHSPAIPPPPRGCLGQSFMGRFSDRVVVLSLVASQRPLMQNVKLTGGDDRDGL